MRSPGLFIGSSERAKPLASALRSRIKGEGIPIDIKEWWVKTFEPGTQTLSALIDACQDCDFAVILFTADDLRLKLAAETLQFQGKQEHFIARDNCVFEAGLFIGGLELQPRRCFILSSLNKDGLPTDLQGLTYLSFNPPANLADGKACESAVESSAIRIIDAIRELGRRERPQLSLITLEELMEMEQRKPHGNLVKGSVVVSSAEPMELDYRFAERVRKNMGEGVDYCYFFPANPGPEPVSLVCDMVQMISIASLAGGNENPSPKDRLKIMEEKSKEVSDNLDEMQSHLSIYFLPDQARMHICGHNAGSTEDAQCYLRYPRKGFVKWPVGPESRAVVDELLDFRNLEHEGFVFRSTKKYDLYGETEESKKMRTALLKGIEKHFAPSLLLKVKEVCFGKEQAQKAAG